MAAQEKKLVRHFSAGGAVYRKRVPRESSIAQVEWLLIRPAGTDRWQLPKGEINTGEGSKETAEREVFEETGVKAQVREKIDSFKYFYQTPDQRILKTVTFYIMASGGEEAKVAQEWKQEIAEVGWFPYTEAIKKLTFDSERKVLQKANELSANRLI